MAAWLALAACGGAGGGAGPDGGVELACEVTRDIPIAPPLRFDVLLVVDDSPSMADEQATLAVNLPRFANVLESIEGGLPDLQIAVVSADARAGGRFSPVPRRCGVAGPFLVDHRRYDGSRERNYTGDLEDALPCIAELGTGGGEITEPLEAMRLALDPGNPDAQGFVRDDGELAVIFLTDEDDCSAPVEPDDPFDCTRLGVTCAGGAMPDTPGAYAGCAPSAERPGGLYHPDRYADFLLGLKADPAQIIVGAVFGPPEPFAVGPGPVLLPSCDNLAGSATPGVRLANFLAHFPQRNTLTTICDDDLSDVLTLFANLLRVVIGSPCLDDVDPTDVDPDAPGVQPDCSVSDVRFPYTSNQEESLLPRCPLDAGGAPTPDGPRPCWWVDADPLDCADIPGSLALHVERSDFPPAGTHVIARCAGTC